MWTATAGDGSEIFSAMRMSDRASLGFRGLDLSLNSPKPLPVLRSHAAIPRFTSFPSPAVAVHIARRRFIENHSLLAEVSHDVNDGRETSAGFRRVIYPACARVSLTTSDVFVTCDTTQITGFRIICVFPIKVSGLT